MLIKSLNATVTRLESQSQQPSVDPDINDRVGTLEELSKLRMAPTCEHLSMYGVSKSGSYNINLNKNAIGANPVEVHCNFTMMTTEVLPVSTQPVVIDNCAGSGCFTHDVDYLASLSQLEELIDLSVECTQDITFDCNSAALELNDLSLGAWIDRHGRSHHFFDGSNPEEHTCKCGTEENCISSHLKCNCNAKRPEWMQDVGTITCMDLLPIKSFTYGPLELDLEQAKVTIGSLKCKGLKVINDDVFLKPVGPPGERGVVGAPGTPGQRGQQGEKGVTGAPGPSGQRGPRGEKGVTGALGNDVRFSLTPVEEAVAPTKCPAEGRGCPVNELFVHRQLGDDRKQCTWS